MTQKRNYFTIYIPLLLFISFNSFSQDTVPKEFSKVTLRSAARDIIKDAGVCALITLDEQGLPSTRVMDPFLPEDDFTVWLGTNPHSRKVKQIKSNPKVTLYYLDKNSSGYVVIQGIATLVNEQASKDKWWKTEWDAFYPNNSDAYQLIKISPKRLEVISYTHNIIGDPKTWEVPVVIFNSNK